MQFFDTSTLSFWKLLWPLFAMMFVVGILKLFFEIILPDLIENHRNKKNFKAGAKWRSDRELLLWLRGMNPAEFEKYIAELFKNLGYEANAVGRSHDGGVDVELLKDGIKGYVQCKKYISSTVSVGEVRDFYGALADRLLHSKGYFITTNKFTLEAQRFADDKPIELIDGSRLIEYIHLASKDRAIIEPLQSEDAMICPRCGGHLVERKGKFGKFIGCSNYPKCAFTRKE